MDGKTKTRPKIYGGLLSHLSKEIAINHNGKILYYPLKHGQQIYFPLELMEDISELDIETRERLKKLSSRNYEYPAIQESLF